MNQDISEEAKKALADVNRRKAIDRLQRDGCASMDAVRRRVLAIAAERNLQPAEFAKLLHKRVSTRVAIALCDKHKISLDWLLYGDLKGLQRMTQAAKAEPRALSEEDWSEFIGLVGKIEPQRLSHVLKYMRILAAEAKLRS